MSSAESHFGLLDSTVRSVERLYEGELYFLPHTKKVSALSLLYKIYHRLGNPINGYLNHFGSARNTRGSAALGELALVIPRYRTDQFRRSFQPVAVHSLWNLLPSGVFGDGTLSSFMITMNLCTEDLAWFFISFFSVLLLFYSFLGVVVLGPFWFLGVSLFLVLCTRKF